MALNSTVLVGRLTKDPTIKYTPNGKVYSGFVLAVNRTFTNQNGEREADFILCRAWGKQAENLANFMRKGSQVGVTGRIQTSSFVGQDGKKTYTTEVVAESISFLENKQNGSQSVHNSSNQYQQQQPPNNEYYPPF